MIEITAEAILLDRAASPVKTVYLQRANCKFLPKVSWVKSLLSLGALSGSAIRIVQDGVTLDRGRHAARLCFNGSAAENVLRTSVVKDALDRGHTIVVDDVGLWDPQVLPICAAVFTSSWRYVNASYFITPGGSYGFPFHADSEMTAVFQISGQKEWRFIDAPADVVGGLGDEALPSGDSGMVVLSPGDVLIIPERFPHATRSVGSDTSIHLTIGVRNFTCYELLQEIFSFGSKFMSDTLSGNVEAPIEVISKLNNSLAAEDLCDWEIELAKASIRIVTNRYCSPGDGFVYSGRASDLIWCTSGSAQSILFARGRLLRIPGEVAGELRSILGRSMLNGLSLRELGDSVLSSQACQVLEEIWKGGRSESAQHA